MSAWRPVVYALVASGSLAACFSEHQAPTGIVDPVPDVACSVDFPTPGPREIIVAIRDFAFHPSQVTVPAGTTVTWLNCEESGVAAHTTTSDGGAWESGLLAAAGGRFSRTFEVEGSFPYHCTPHPFMQGTVVVQDP